MKKFYLELLMGCLFCIMGNVVGQVSITSLAMPSVQNFDAIGTSATAALPTGFKIGTDWSSATTATTLAYGTSGAGVVTSSSSGGSINWANGVTASSTERSLGFLATGTYTSPRSVIYAFTNNTGNTISSLDIVFNYEKSRSGTRAFDWTFFHGNTSTAITAATAGDQAYAADANNTVISDPPLSVSKSFSLAGLSIAPGITYYLRWTYTGLGGSTNSQGLSIDDFSITAFSNCTVQTITAISPASITKTYGDASYSVATSASSGLAVSYASSNSAVATVDASGNVTIARAGTATITASQAGNGTYCPAPNVTQTLTVNPKPITINGLTANNKIFDGNTTATLSGTPSLSGVLVTDASNVVLAGTPVANFSSSAVGTWSVIVTGYSISGTRASNYSLTQPSGLTASITAPANSIMLAPSTQAKGPYCNASGNAISLIYTITGTVTAPFLELSNASGSFASGTTNIGGIVTGSGTFTISGSIPSGHTAGTLYRVRIRSTDATPVISLDNGSDIIIYAQPSVAPISGTANVCVASTITFTNATVGGTWSVVNGTGTGSITTIGVLTGSTAGTVSVVYTVTNGTCTNTTTSSVTVNALPATPSGTIAATTPACSTTELTISSTAPGTETYYWQTTATGTTTTNSGSNFNATSSGTYYVRSRNNTTLCWGPATTGYGIVVNTPIIITTQPTDRVVTSPTNATFTVAATGTSTAFQWQIYNGTAWVNLANGSPYSGVTSTTLTITPSSIALDDNNYRVVVNGASPCTSVTSNIVTLTVNPGPCVSESFANIPPTNGTYLDRVWTGDNGGTWTATRARTDLTLTGRAIATDGVGSVTASSTSGGIGTLSFNYVRAFTGTGSRTIQVWLNGNQIGADIIVSPTSDLVQSYSATIDISGTVSLELRTTGNQIIIDDLSWSCYTACTPTQTIASFSPISGPVGTLITINGTGFTAGATVKVGGIAASAVTFVNSSTLTAEVPSGAISGPITVTQSGCSRISGSDFTLLSQNANCGNGAVPVSNGLIISEVLDSKTGSLSYIELFNPTSAGIALTNYSLRIATGANTDYALGTATIASGGIYIVRLGNPGISGTTVCQITANLDLGTTATGFNGNDQVMLLLNGSVHDVVDNPSYPGTNPLSGDDRRGFSQLRNAGATTPRTTFVASEWTNADPESCDHLTVVPASVSSTNITINTNPSDVNCTNTLTLSVAATGTPAISTTTGYTWRYQSPGSSTWALVSALNGTNGLLVAGSGSNSITISGATGPLLNYQFYAEIGTGSPQCIKYSNAAQYSYSTKPYYRSKIASANWSSPASWEMADNAAFSSGLVNACNYPTSLNSSEIFISAANNITLDIDNVVNKLSVNGTLTNNSTNQLTVNNAGAGADFIVNGTYQDNAGSANTFTLNTGATWLLGTGGTIIKTDLGGGADYRDKYEGGIVNIPSSASWIYRHIASDINMVGSTTTAAMYYPNLTFEKSEAGSYASVLNNASPQFSRMAFYGANNPIIVKGNLDIGGTGLGTVSVSNISSFANVTINGNVNVRTGNTLKLDSANATNKGMGFDIKGNLLTDGILTATVGISPTGQLVLSGTTAQSITGSGTMTLEDVNINNTGAGIVTVNKNFDIPGSLDFGNAAAKLTLGTGTITLKSTSARTANVGVIPAGVAINYSTGKFVVERYLRAGRKWRLLSVPTINASQSILTSWQENRTTPNTYGFQAADPRGDFFSRGFELAGFNSSVKKFNDVSVAWDAVDYTNTFNMNSQRGYMVFVPGDRTVVYPNGGATTLRTSGTINMGTMPIINVPAGKFAIIGNPYASRIDIRNIGFTNSGVEQSVAVWDPTLTGAYGLGAWNYLYREDPFTNEYSNQFASGIYGPKDDPNNFIESGMAFFVRSTTAGTVILSENSKTTGSQVAAFTSGLRQAISVNLQLSSGTLLDGVKAQYSNEYSNAVDGYDIHKMQNLGEEVSLKSADSMIVIERRAMIQQTDTLHLHISRMKPQSYQWEILSDNMDFPGRSGFLIDRFKNISTPLSMTGATKVNFDVENVAASYAADRFVIVFTQPELAPVPVTFTTVTAIRKEDRSIRVQWQVENEIQVSRYDVERSADGRHFSSINNRGASANNAGPATYPHTDLVPLPLDNYYRIKATSADGQVQYSSIVKVGLVKEAQGISVYPNPVVAKNIQVRFTELAAGSYQLQLTNAAGQTIYKSVLNISNAVQVQSLKLPANTAAGNYQLSVVAADGTVKQVQVSVE